jgi:hypothetical protein
MAANIRFTKPDPNDRGARRDRNANLSAILAPMDEDIVEIFLETLPSGRTRWCIVYRDGTTDSFPNP